MGDAFVTWEQLDQKLDKLRRNRRQVSLKDQMGKYKAAFDKLETEIQQDAWPMVIGYITRPMIFHPEWNVPGTDAEKRYRVVMDRMESRIHGWKEDGTASEILRNLTYTMNTEKFLVNCMDKLYPGLWWEDYAEYWTSYSRETEDGWVNDLIPGMVFDPATEMWWQDGSSPDEGNAPIIEQKNNNFYLGLPPTMEGVRKVVKRCEEWQHKANLG